MKGSPWLASPSVMAAVGASLLATATVYAQPPARGPGPNAIHILVVPAFTSTDKVLGCTAANEVRDRLDGDVDTKEIWIIQTTNIEETLKASGFPACQPISPTDAKQLTQQLRGEAFIDGAVSKTATGVRIEPRLVLQRDLASVQPLAPAEAAKVGDAAKIVSKEVLAAMKQWKGEEACFNAARSQQYPAAITAANQAIAAYPQAALARLCIVNTLVAMKATPDSIIAVTQGLLKDDPHNARALELSAQAYYDKKDYDNAVKAWGTLIAADPTNTGRIEDVVTKIVQSGHADAAVPIVNQAVKDNPDEPKFVVLQCRLLIAAHHDKDSPAVCLNAVKVDTAFADTLRYQQIVTAQLADSQPQAAATTASQGLAKFPNSVTLAQLQVQALQASGQTQQAVDAIHKMLGTNPKIPTMWEQLLSAYVTQKQYDSAFSAAHQAVANGDDGAKIAGFTLPVANAIFKAAQANKNNDTLDLAIKWAKYSDSLSASPAAKFIAGAAEFQIGLSSDQEGAKSKSCDLVKKAQTYWKNADPDLHGGGSISPQAAGQMLQLINQYSPAIDKQVKALCKG